MPRKDPKKYLIRQSNKISFSRHNLTAVEKRIVYLLVSKIKPDDRDFNTYTFTAKELLEGTGIGLDNHTYLKETTENLLSKVYNIPTDDGGLLQISPISSAKYDENNTTVTFKFDPDMKPHYLELKQNYTQFQLNIVIGLKSVYSQKLYEIAKSIANRANPSMRYSISEWRYLLFIEPGEYKDYYAFKSKVFNTAQKELVEKTDLHIEFKEEKAGNRVNWVWMEVYKIENEEERLGWIRQTKFNQLPKKVRESLLQSSGAAGKSTLDDIAANVAARQKAIAEAEEMGLFDKKIDASSPDDELNEE